MAVSAKFLADFTSFESAVKKAELKLTEFRTESSRVESALKRVGDSFSGKKILSDAALAVRAVQELGGVSKLTTSEQARLHSTVSEAIAKYKALGEAAPPELIAIANATKSVVSATDKMAAGMAAMGKIGRKAFEEAVASDKLIAGMSSAGKAAADAGRKMETAFTGSRGRLNDMVSGIAKAQADLSRLSTAFSGKDIIRDAGLTAAAVQSIGGASRLTASEQKQVNAVVAEAIAKYKALGQDAPQSLKEIEKATRQAEESTKGLSTSMIAIGTAIGTFVGNLAVTAVKALGREFLEMATNGVKLAPIVSSFERLTASIGETSDAMLNVTRTATKGLISDLDIMQASNKAILLGLPVTAKEFGVLGEAAVSLGRAMGQDAAKSLDDLITALGRSSPMILDNLGLTVKVEEANKAYAASVKKSSEELTDAEKKLAFYNAAMEAAKKKVEDLGGIQLTLADQLQRVKVVFGNFTDALGVAIARSPVLTGLLGDLAKGFEDTFGGNQVSRIQSLIGTVNTVALKLFDVGQAAIVMAGVLNRVVEGIKAPFFAFASAVTSVGLAFLHARAASLEFSASLPVVGKSFRDAAASARSAVDFLEGFQKGLHDEAVSAGQAVLGNSAFQRSLDGLSASLSDMKVKSEAASKTQIDSGVIAQSLTGKMKGTAAATTEAGKAAEALKKELAALAAQFGGAGVLKTAQQYETTLNTIGGASRLTATELEDFSKVFQAVIDKYTLMGPSGAAVVRHFEALKASLPQSVIEANTLNETFSRWVQVGNDANITTKRTIDFFSAMPAAIQSAAVSLTSDFLPAIDASMDQLRVLMAGPKNIAGANQGVSRSVRLVGQTVGSEITSSIVSSFRNFPTLLGQALTGGGGFKGFGQALAVDLGSGITDKLFGGGGLFSGVASKIGGLFGTSGIGKAIGDSLSSIIPGIGAFIGPAISGLGKLFGKLFSSEGKKVNDMRDAFLSTAGGLDAVADRARRAGTSVDALLKAGKVKDFEKAVNDLNKAFEESEALLQKYNVTWEDFGGTFRTAELGKQIQKLNDDIKGLERAGLSHESAVSKVADAYVELGIAAVRAGEGIPPAMAPVLRDLARMGKLTNEQAAALLGMANSAVVDFQRMEEVAKKYGIEISALGPRFQEAKLGFDATSIINDFQFLIDAGADINGVIAGMADELQAVVKQGIEFGIALPEAMRPVLQRLVEQGKLTDASGNKLEDLADIKFAEPIEAAIQSLIEKLDELIGKIGGTGDAFSNLVNKAGQVPNAPSGYLPGDNPWQTTEFPMPELPGFARGTRGRFLNFGAGTPVMLHGREKVVPEGQSSTDTAMADEMRALRSDIKYFISLQPSSLRDAVLRAPR